MTQPAALAWAAEMQSRWQRGLVAVLTGTTLTGLIACTDPEPPKDPPRVPRPKMAPDAESSEQRARPVPPVPRKIQVNDRSTSGDEQRPS